jgi:hypothetical protein
MSFLFQNYLLSQISHRINFKLGASYLIGENLKVPEEITDKEFENLFPCLNAGLGFYIGDKLLLNANLGTNFFFHNDLFDSDNWYDYWNIDFNKTFDYTFWNFSLGLRYYFKPYRKFSLFVFGEMNATMNNWNVLYSGKADLYSLDGPVSEMVVDYYLFRNEIISYGGSGGIGLLFNAGKNIGIYAQTYYLNNGFLNNIAFETGLNLKLLRKIK